MDAYAVPYWNLQTPLSVYRFILQSRQSSVSGGNSEFVLYLREPWDNNSCRGTCSPDSVAEPAGTMDSTAVAEQRNPSLPSETGWPGVTETSHFKARRQRCVATMWLKWWH